MRRARGAFVAMALVLVSAGCADTVDGFGRAPVPVPTSSAAPSTSSITPPSPSTTASLPPGPEFSTVRYDLPSGFTATGDFVIDVPLEELHHSYWVTPTGHTDGSAGVISITVYTLPKAGLVDTAAQRMSRIAMYDKRLKVTVVKPLRSGKLAGRPAFTDTVLQPPNFHLENWYTFGKTHFLEFTCQLGAAATDGALQVGCDQLRESLQTN